MTLNISKELGHFVSEIGASYHDGIFCDTFTVDLMGDIEGGVVLSKLVYWFTPSKKDGSKKTRVERDGRDWVAKRDEEWFEECRITKKRLRRIKEKLIELGLVEINVWKFNGMPMCHYSLNLERYGEIYYQEFQKKFAEVPKGHIQKCQKGTSRTAQRDQTITYTTYIDYKHKNSSRESALDKKKSSTLKQKNAAAKLKKLQEEVTSSLASIGVKGKQQLQDLSRYNFSSEEIIKACKYAEKKKDIKNKVGWIVQCIQEKWYDVPEEVDERLNLYEENKRFFYNELNLKEGAFGDIEIKCEEHGVMIRYSKSNFHPLSFLDEKFKHKIQSIHKQIQGVML